MSELREMLRQPEYKYVDSAIGGLAKRGHIVDIDRFTFNGTPDVFTTYAQFTDELVTWANEHRTKDGRPSVRGYPGPAFVRFLPLDFDYEPDPSVALADIRRVLEHFEYAHEIPYDAVRVYFSGRKGFSAEIPLTLFGPVGPSADVTQRLKRLAFALTDGLGLTTLDTSIYDKTRLWRQPNSIHGDSGLYKVPLDAGEVLSLDIDAIRDLASAPRTIAWQPDNEWVARPHLVELWQQTAVEPARENMSAASDGAIAPGHRHEALLRVAGAMRHHGVGEDAILMALRADNAARCNPPKGDEELQKIARDVAAYPAGTSAHAIITGIPKATAQAFTPLGVDDWLAATDDDDLDVILSDGGDGAVLPRDGKMAIAAGPGVAKTNMLMRFGRSAAEGAEWLRLPFARPCRVLHFATEGSRRGYRKRGRKIWDGASAEAKERYQWMQGPLDILADLSPLGDLVLAHQADVLIIDLLRNAHGLDENDSKQMAQLSAALDALIARCNCAVVLAHHDRKAHPMAKTFDGIDSVRGSTAFTGWLSACLSVRRKPRVQDVLLADWVKVRDAEEALPPLELEFVRSTIDFKVSTRNTELDVLDAVLTAVFHNGELTKAEIVAIVAEQGFGKRAIGDAVVLLAKEGRLVGWIKPEHTKSRTKTYRMAEAQAELEEPDDDDD